MDRPPRRIVQVQAILLASLFTSLLSAFLAMLGKQWLNRCMPVDTRGTIVQRSQHRQRKFDGIVNWYFDNVMEALPLMLQVALLLLGCALSRYLWEIDTTVASVVLGITAFGLLFYVFIVIAGVVSENCPYQTPVANFLRYVPVAISHTPLLLYRNVQGVFRFVQVILRHIRATPQRVPNVFRRPPLIFNMLRSGFLAFEDSYFRNCLANIYRQFKKLRNRQKITANRILGTSFAILILLPIFLIIDLCRAIIWLLTSFTSWVRQVGLEPHTEQTTEQQIVSHVLDLRCVLWTLQTSVDGPIRQSALEYLATITMDDSNPTRVVASWFNIFLNCVQVTDGSMAIIQGYELVAQRSSLFCLHMLSHLVVTDSMPKVFEDVRQRFTGTFPSKTNFGDLPVSRTLGIIRTVFSSNRTEGLRNTFLLEGPTRPLAPQAVRWRVQWDSYKPSGSDYAVVAGALAKFAQFEYKGSGERAKVPRWLLRFALHSLSQDPPLPPSTIYDSLLIIAIDLDCKTPDTTAVNSLDQR